ncbi:MAG: fluoride efflux transporter CrcB [Burkholderiales bacterium]|nr:MAG: fluoride efflux transporter CrcB [Burkholderiales bacterium]
MNALAVSIGAALGALARWQVGLLFNARWAGFPLGTLLVNLVGGLLIGMALEWFGRQPSELMKLLLVTGFLGGLTTFSAFSGESLVLLKHGQFGMALAHTLAHVAGSLLAAGLGMRIVQALI